MNEITKPTPEMNRRSFLAVAALFQLADAAQAVGAGVLRGVQDTRVPMLIALFGYWVVGFGSSVLFGFGLGWGGVGVWFGLLAGLAAASVLLLSVFVALGVGQRTEQA